MKVILSCPDCGKIPTILNLNGVYITDTGSRNASCFCNLYRDLAKSERIARYMWNRAVLERIDYERKKQ